MHHYKELILSKIRRSAKIQKRPSHFASHQENTIRYQQMANESAARNNNNQNTNSGFYQPNTQQNMNQNTQSVSNNYNDNYIPPTPPSVPPTNNFENYGQNPSNINPYILELSQPNYNAPFDVIPLPSKGKTYKNKKVIKPGTKDEMIEFNELSKTGGIVNLYEAIKMAEGIVKVKVIRSTF